jgi:hypothetical protein
VVASGAPDTWITLVFVKPDPMTVSVTAFEPAATWAGVMEVIAGVAGDVEPPPVLVLPPPAFVLLEPPPPHPEIATRIPSPNPKVTIRGNAGIKRRKAKDFTGGPTFSTTFG